MKMEFSFSPFQMVLTIGSWDYYLLTTGLRFIEWKRPISFIRYEYRGRRKHLNENKSKIGIEIGNNDGEVSVRADNIRHQKKAHSTTRVSGARKLFIFDRFCGAKKFTFCKEGLCVCAVIFGRISRIDPIGQISQGAIAKDKIPIFVFYFRWAMEKWPFPFVTAQSANIPYNSHRPLTWWALHVWNDRVKRMENCITNVILQP